MGATVKDGVMHINNFFVTELTTFHRLNIFFNPLKNAGIYMQGKPSFYNTQNFIKELYWDFL